ncbi:MAG: hypothetical protein UU99_C0005G0001 [Parcubacteria group bacterium GW2011_GWE2_42_14]|nr:MAG: hypothetical protein UU99_C0005G0001 [Parcubacteria group bacterium GW2011_GWE2_42_14]
MNKLVEEGTSAPYRVLFGGTLLVPGLEIWSTRWVTVEEGVTGAGGVGTLALGATTGEVGAPGKFKLEPAYIRFGFLILGFAFRMASSVVPFCLAIPESV